MLTVHLDPKNLRHQRHGGSVFLGLKPECNIAHAEQLPYHSDVVYLHGLENIAELALELFHGAQETGFVITMQYIESMDLFVKHRDELLFLSSLDGKTKSTLS